MTSYVLSPRARRDLSDIWDYSAERWGVAQADRYVRLIISACEDIAAGRVKGHSAEAIRTGYLRHSIGSHVVFFKMRRRSGIEVVRILHQRMDVGRHL